MKILVFSDTHGAMEPMTSIIAQEQPDAVLHLGDHIRDAEALRVQFPALPIIAVPGNCDPGSREPDTRIQAYAGVTIFMTHGHRYWVKQSPLRAEYAAREAGAQVLLFGHTHQPLCEQKDGLWICNPGACQPRSGGNYAVLELSDGVASCRLAEAD
jgi:hypothetical protein